jgi:hypothetical protein
VLIIVGVLVAITSYNPKINIQTKTKWHTYSNTYMGYSINYESGWQIHSVYPDDKYMDGKQVDITTTPNVYLLSSSYKQSIALKEELTDQNKTFEENVDYWLNYYLSSTAELGNAHTDIIDVENYEIQGRKIIKNTISYKFDDTNDTGTAVWIYVPVSEKHLLSIKYSSDDSDKNELNHYSEIVSTLRF